MSNSIDYHLGNLRPIIVAMLEGAGRITDKSVCELCFKEIPDNKYDLHHTRYKGATVFDLLVVCRKCNTQQKNRYLA